MSFLKTVTFSTSNVGIRAIIAGVEKVGKTTLCCSAPRSLLVPLELGYSGIRVSKTDQLESYDDVLKFIDEVINTCQKKQFMFQSIIFDSGTALERLIHDKTVRMDPQYSPGNKKTVTMDSALGGYGKAFDFANMEFGKFLVKADELAFKYGINIILTCHVFASKTIDPSVGEFNQWDLLLHSPKNNRTYGKREMLCQWADLVGFLHEPMFVSKASDDSTLIGISANKGRILGLERTPNYVAGNRYNLHGVIAIPTEYKDSGWNYIADAIFKSSGLDYYNKD